MRNVYIRIDRHLLEQMFGIPEEVKITGMGYHQKDDEVVMILTSDKFPENIQTPTGWLEIVIEDGTAKAVAVRLSDNSTIPL